MNTAGTVYYTRFSYYTPRIAKSTGAVEYIDCISSEYPVYDTKQSDGEVPVMLELWGMRSTLSLTSLPGLLWPGVAAPDRVIYGSNRTKLRTYTKLNRLK